MRPQVVRDGLGYRYEVPGEGVSIRADRIRESSGELTAELTVERAPEGHLAVTRINLLASQTRASFAKALALRSNHFDWAAAMEALCLGVLALERQGDPWVAVGRQPARISPPYLLAPFLFERKPTILFGEGGLGKSTVLASAIAVAVATGVVPMREWRSISTGPVIVLDWEGEPEDWNDSLVGICRGLAIDPIEVDHRVCRGPLETQIHAIVERAERIGAALVIVDSAEAAMRSPRDSGTDDPAKRFYDALRLVPAAALVIDHVSKAVIEHGGRGSPIGNVTKTNRARATWELRTSRKPDADGTRHLKLLNRKMNLDREHPPMGIGVLRADGAIRLWGEAIADDGDQIARRAPERRTRVDQLVALLSDRGRMSVLDITTATDFEARRVKDLVREARAKGHDVHFEDGMYWLEAPVG